jgi:hypothetical protein
MAIQGHEIVRELMEGPREMVGETTHRPKEYLSGCI